MSATGRMFHAKQESAAHDLVDGLLDAEGFVAAQGELGVSREDALELLDLIIQENLPCVRL